MIYLPADILLQYLSEEAEESHETSKVRTNDSQIEVKIITATTTSYKRKHVCKVSGHSTSSSHNF